MQGVKLKKSPLAANNSVYIYLYIPFATSTINLLGLLHPMGNDSHRGESVSLNLPLYLSIYIHIYIYTQFPPSVWGVESNVKKNPMHNNGARGLSPWDLHP
jgi:dolichyl-phosphate-mannose--protein O-mannosyl transferase